MSSFTLHLRDGRCIHGAAETRHHELVTDLLSRDDELSEVAAEELELLTEFLESTDFKSLRAQRPTLDGRSEVKVCVTKTGPGLFVVEVMGQEGS